jgi:uncharacterized BrkB/YihY/UPF0761 family membrane protein
MNVSTFLRFCILKCKPFLAFSVIGKSVTEIYQDFSIRFSLIRKYILIIYLTWLSRCAILFIVVFNVTIKSTSNKGKNWISII